jgi:ribokinase
MRSSIVVVGSSNTDMVVKAEHLPAPGETVLGGTFFMNAGGKGANQAVAAARLGGNVTFIAKTGNDIFGQQAITLFNEEGMKTSYIITDEVHPSGVALITVDKNGENCIVVASGANAALNEKDIENAREVIERATIVLMQLETPLDTIKHVIEIAAPFGVKVVLNPAPARVLPAEMLRHVSIITPNEKEAEMLTGIRINDISGAKEAASELNKTGIQTVIITMGSEGALVLHEGEFSTVTAPKVSALDTTAAGDVFNGALVVALSEKKEMLQAVQFACNAAAISVTRLGAQASAPYRNEVV